MGHLTTHVLDTALGKPAGGITVELWSTGAEPKRLATVKTDEDGRTSGPALSGEEFVKGVYELRFMAGDYLRASGVDLPGPPFLDVIPIRFGIADEKAHYHVPLLLSPYGYSTYRGS